MTANHNMASDTSLSQMATTVPFLLESWADDKQCHFLNICHSSFDDTSSVSSLDDHSSLETTTPRACDRVSSTETLVPVNWSLPVAKVERELLPSGNKNNAYQKHENGAGQPKTESLAHLSRNERRRRRRATQKYRAAHASRERVRVEAFNVAFSDLRKLLPTLSQNKKLSKIEILRLAICYISYLKHVLDLS